MQSFLDYTSVKPLVATVVEVSAAWSRDDYVKAVKLRWGLGRNNSKVMPGLYKIGVPNSQSDVFVSSNYTLSFNTLRKNLNGMNAWILVIDTKGINVWCAAGKGTFGTETLVKYIEQTSLKDIVKHRRVIVPQLAATGVAAHKVKKLSEFSVVFGPVRACDINEFVNGGYKATPVMRKITFPFKERAKLIPVDLIYGMNKLFIALFILFFFSGIDKEGFLFLKMIHTSLLPITGLLCGYIAGIVFTPLFLPYIPFRAFSLKGAIAGVFVSLCNLMIFSASWVEWIAVCLIAISVSSFMAMNFTGSSTYTSLSGVKLEMKWALPFQIGFASIGFLLFVLSKFI